LREDKKAREVVREVPRPVEQVADPSPPAASSPPPSAAKAAKRAKPAKGTKKSSARGRIAKAAPAPSRPLRGRSPEGEARSSKRGPKTGGEAYVAGVRLTHPDRVLYPPQGITKRDLALYYESIADWILPHVKGRPLTLVRCPEGAEKECFYMKHSGVWAPSALRRVAI